MGKGDANILELEAKEKRLEAKNLELEAKEKIMVSEIDSLFEATRTTNEDLKLEYKLKRIDAIPAQIAAIRAQIVANRTDITAIRKTLPSSEPGDADAARWTQAMLVTALCSTERASSGSGVAGSQCVICKTSNRTTGAHVVRHSDVAKVLGHGVPRPAGDKSERSRNIIALCGTFDQNIVKPVSDDTTQGCHHLFDSNQLALIPVASEGDESIITRGSGPDSGEAQQWLVVMLCDHHLHGTVITLPSRPSRRAMRFRAETFIHWHSCIDPGFNFEERVQSAVAKAISNSHKLVEATVLRWKEDITPERSPLEGPPEAQSPGNTVPKSHRGPAPRGQPPAASGARKKKDFVGYECQAKGCMDRTRRTTQDKGNDKWYCKVCFDGWERQNPTQKASAAEKAPVQKKTCQARFCHDRNAPTLHHPDTRKWFCVPCFTERENFVAQAQTKRAPATYPCEERGCRKPNQPTLQHIETGRWMCNFCFTKVQQEALRAERNTTVPTRAPQQQANYNGNGNNGNTRREDRRLDNQRQDNHQDNQRQETRQESRQESRQRSQRQDNQSRQVSQRPDTQRNQREQNYTDFEHRECEGRGCTNRDRKTRQAENGRWYCGPCTR
jgi:hypothetical protein